MPEAMPDIIPEGMPERSRDAPALADCQVGTYP
jgi:hypothetical protein